MKKRKTYEVSVINKTYSKTYSDQTKFYTSDTALELNFQIKEVEYDFDSAEIILLNIDDRSLATRPVTKSAEGFTYELEDDITARFGEWKGQLKFNKGGEIYVSSPVSFRIENDLNNDRPPQLTDIRDWETLRQSAKDLIAELGDVVANESSRIEAEKQRVEGYQEMRNIIDNFEIGENAVGTENIKDGAVSADKTDFLITSDLNLFNEATSLKGKVLNYKLGIIQDNADWQVSAYIEAEPNTQYTSNHIFRYAEYDANNTFVAGNVNIVSFTTSSNARKFRITFPIDVTDFIISKGSDVPVYQDYNQIVGIKGIDFSKDVDLENLKGELEYEKSINLYETIPPRLNKSMNALGVIVDSTSYHLMEIPVSAGEEYTVSRPRGYFAIFKNSSGDIVSMVTATTNDVSQSFVVPENATRLFINVYKEYLTNMLIYKNAEYHDGFKLTNLKIDYENILNSPKFSNQWAGKKGVTFGDSITWYDGENFLSTHKESGSQAVGYQTYLRNDLDVTIVNVGASGNNLTQILGIIKAYDFTNTDFATITSGANDWSQERAIGNLALPQSTFNENTFYGALQSAVEFIINANSKTKIVLITPIRGYHPTNTHSGEWLTKGRLVDGMLEQPEDYANAIKEVAELYGLDYVDFRDYTGLNFLTNALYLGDDPTKTSGKLVHPNNLYYEKMGKYIVSQFKTFAI